MAKKDISRTLIIGLGGTGQTVIREVKKRLLRRYGEVPELVQFLSFDTDDESYDSTPFSYYFGGENRTTLEYNLLPEEFKKINRPLFEVVEEEEACKYLNKKKLQEIYGLLQASGANGYRVMGRAHFLADSKAVIEKLKKAIDTLKNVTTQAYEAGENEYNISANQGVSVYVIASLAGGTGSSAIMDISRMLQHAGINLVTGANAAPDKIFGVFFMPSFFKDKPMTPNIQINTYTALSELDYTLGLSKKDEHSEERERDLNLYQGTENTNYAVQYSNVFLVDKSTKSNNNHEFSEAAGYVASFLTVSIAADAATLESAYSNSTHKLRQLNGKHQLYSGLGFCEIRFDRQNLVEYLLNRQLRESLMKFKDGSPDDNVDEIADRFIKDNQLNEGIKPLVEGEEDTRSQLNELINSIYSIDDKRFTAKVMSTTQTGKEASKIIVKSKNNYLTEIQGEINDAIKGFAAKKKALSDGLRRMLDEYQTKEGFSRFPDLAKRLCRSFQLMKEGLEDEISQHVKQEESVNNSLKTDEIFIRDHYGNGFFGLWGSEKEAQKQRISAYKAKVERLGSNEAPTLCRLALEIARKKEAVKVYDDLINIVNSYYIEEVEEKKGKKSVKTDGSFTEILTIFEGLKKMLDAKIDSYKPSKATKNETIYLDAYLKDYFEQNKGRAFVVSEDTSEALFEQFGKIMQQKNEINDKLIASLRHFLMTKLSDDSLIKKIQGYTLSIDELFIECFGLAKNITDRKNFNQYPQLAIFDQLAKLFDPLWRYVEFVETKSGGSNSLPPQMVCVVGVFNKDNYILDKKNGYGSFLPNGKYQPINVGDPDRILFVLIESAIPAFKMADCKLWQSEYDKMKEGTYSYSDERLEGIEMITPEALNENAEIAWAYGWMFGLIARVKGRYQVKPSSTYMSNGQKRVIGPGDYFDYFQIKKQISSDLSVCHRQFIRDIELYSDIYDQAMKLLKEDKPRSIVRIKHWVNDDEIKSVEVTRPGRARRCCLLRRISTRCSSGCTRPSCH